jgi:hypothetical protein
VLLPLGQAPGAQVLDGVPVRIQIYQSEEKDKMRIDTRRKEKKEEEEKRVQRED